MASQPYSEAKARANSKWDEENKDRKKFINYRANAKGFVRPTAKSKEAILYEYKDEYVDSLIELKTEIERRLEELKGS